MNAIEANNVWKKFKIPHEKRDTLVENAAGFIKGEKATYEEFWALKNINFNVKEGECIGIIGENGSGKSTLLRIISNILPINKGNVKVRGSVGPFLELGTGFRGDLTAKENVYLYGYVIGLKKKQIDNVIDNIFEFAELERFRDMKLKDFSSGMNMRLAFSTAISTNPDILLIDEVLAVGDESFQRKCMDKIMEFKSEGKTIVFVSHSLESVKNLCSRGIWLNKGIIETQGSVDQVIDYYVGSIRKKEEEELLEEHKKTEEKIKVKEGEKEKPKKEEKPKNRWGSGEIEITEVKFFNKEGKECHVFETGESMKVKLKYDVKERIKNPLFRAQIYKIDGTFCHGTNTDRHDIKLGKLIGENSMGINYNELNLLPGTYLYTVGVWPNEQSKKPYDNHDKMYKFIIKEKKVKPAKSVGISVIPHEWILSEK